MNSERYQFINLSRLPGRLNTEEAAWFLGFAAHDIPVLISHGMLKPLGDPPMNGTRYFAYANLEPLRMDKKWLDKASAILIRHWKIKNERKGSSYPKKLGLN